MFQTPLALVTGSSHGGILYRSRSNVDGDVSGTKRMAISLPLSTYGRDPPRLHMRPQSSHAPHDPAIDK